MYIRQKTFILLSFIFYIPKMKEETKRKISETNRLKLPEDIVEEIYLMGFPISKVAKMFHCSFTAIRRVLIEKGVTRTLSEATSGANNPMYGSHRAGVDNPNWQGGKVTLICEECGKEYQVNKYRIEGSKYCSPQCNGKAVFREHCCKENHEKGENNPFWTGGRGISWTRHNSKRRELGFKPLNKPFYNSEGHHINKEEVVYIPKKLHQGIYHNLSTGQGMFEINLNTFEFLRNPELQLGYF